MNRDQAFSEEAINSYVDNQLTPEEKIRFYQELEQDSAVAQYACRLRSLREMVQDAYNPSTLPPPSSQRQQRKKLSCYGIAAALLMFVVGACVGWFSRGGLPEQHMATATPASWNTPVARAHNVLLHISDDDPQHFRTAMAEAKQMLARAHAQGVALHLEILTNDSGLDLLRTSLSPYRQEIAQLARRYPNVAFLACGKTLQHLRERGVHYRLLPQAKVVPSALDEIVQRMESGWVYVRV